MSSRPICTGQADLISNQNETKQQLTRARRAITPFPSAWYLSSEMRRAESSAQSEAGPSLLCSHLEESLQRERTASLGATFPVFPLPKGPRKGGSPLDLSE